MFGKFRSPEHLAEQPKETPPSRSRREFLKTAAASAVGLGATGIIMAESGGVKTASAEQEQSQEAGTVHTFESTLESHLKNESRLKEIHATPIEARTLEEQDTLRAWFDTHYSIATLTPIIRAAIREGTNTVERMHGLLRSFDAHGYIYAYAQMDAIERMQATGSYEETRTIASLRETDRSYYALRVADFLPSSFDIRPKDIDPRAWAGQNLADGLITPRDNNENTENIKHIPGWLAPDRQEAVHAYLKNRAIRDALQSDPTMTLAEALSLIKGAIRAAEKNPRQTPLEHITFLMQKRDDFIKTNLLDATTDEYIYIDNTDLNNPFYPLKNTVNRLTEGHASFAHYELQVQEGFSVEEQEHEMKRHLTEDVIGASSGKTVLYFNVHGTDHDVLIKKVGDDSFRLNTEDLAAALIARIQNTKDPHTLGSMTLCIDACKSYDFVAALETTLIKKLHGLEQMNGPYLLPTIITTVHEGANAYESASLYDIFTKTLPEKQPMTGAYLLRRVGPSFYPRGSDLTVQIGDTTERIEIGDANTNSDQAAA